MPLEKESKPLVEFVKRFRKNRLAVAAMFVVFAIFLVAGVFFLLSLFDSDFPYDPNATDVKNKLLGPCGQHWLGTDHLGRDVLARMFHGARISLLVGFVAVGVSATIGIVIGSTAGYFGGRVDSVLMRFVDIVMCFPTFFLILMVVALLNPNFWNVMVVIGLTSWTGTARFVRAEFLSLKERDFVVAARALGAGHRRIMFRHILPNALAPVLVSATLGIAGAILTEAGLSFLGFGVQPPHPTWGNILTQGRTYVSEAWWLTVFPGLAILITVLSFNLFGEGLRDALDPRLKIE
ncbi:MAG: ABC transporter permease [Planctomycetota bacterium]